MNDITHREIYDRLVAVEAKVDALSDSTKDVTTAFAAAQGAFKVLETLSKLAKPLRMFGYQMSKKQWQRKMEEFYVCQ